MFYVFTAPPNQERASAGVESLNGGVLHDGRISGAIGLSDDQRKDHWALKDLEVQQKHRCGQTCIFMLLMIHTKAVTCEDYGMEGIHFCGCFK